MLINLIITCYTLNLWDCNLRELERLHLPVLKKGISIWWDHFETFRSSSLSEYMNVKKKTLNIYGK